MKQKSMWVGGACTGVILLVGGCGDAPAAGADAPHPASVVETIQHEACNDTGHQVQLLDSKGDGKADIKTVLGSNGQPLCRVTDINHDGKADLYEYFDANGTIRRREADYDENGIIDSVEIYEGGRLVSREYDTTGQHRVDTWDHFDKNTGKRTRRERDTNNDGRVDQWWTWDGDKISIAVDRAGNGKPDPSSVIVLGGKPVDAKTAPPATDGGAPTSPGGGPGTAPVDSNAPPPPVAPPAPPPAPAASAKGAKK